MTLQWQDSYKIGDADIDAQHQQLFNLVNTFLAATDKAGLTLGAMSMFKHTREHFAHEESLMRKLKYPAIKAHVAQHNALLSRLNAVADSIYKDTLDRADLEAFLSDWLAQHLATSDAKLAAYVKLQ